ncbi:MAG: zinc ribbon domain-containing protein [Oscillospiraceae bacterium]|nr:zinc ribbon domain-containing protein [Oscillospiraceae bacterium]
MPFYDLYCPECDEEFNILASISEKSGKRIFCPECGSVELKTVYKGAPAYLKNTKMPECPNRHICGAECRH